MYNEELKKAFLDDVKKIRTTFVSYNDFFSRAESYELEYKKDLCTFSTEELQTFLSDIYSARYRYREEVNNIYRRYVDWCVKQNFPGAANRIKEIKDDATKAVRKHYVAGPLHLQKCLDCIFASDDERTLDSTYRCCFWLAYSGMSIEDALDVDVNEIHLQDMEIIHNGVPYPIYRESIKTIRTCMEMESFVYRHPLYSKDIIKHRGVGTNLLRGTKQKSVLHTIRPLLSERAILAYNSGAIDQIIQYGSIRLSGFYYRTYEMERAGFDPDFSWIVEPKPGQKNFERPNMLNRIRACKRDYANWKKAFFTTE